MTVVLQNVIDAISLGGLFALAYFLQHLVVLVAGARSKSITFLSELGGFFTWGELRIPKLQLTTIGGAAILQI